MIALLKKIHRLWYLFLVAFFFYLFYPFFYYFSRKEERYSSLNSTRKVWSTLSFFLAGYLIRIQRDEPLDTTRPYIFCPNHSSYLDIPSTCFVAHGAFSFIGKEELLKSPILKLFFETIDIPVNRESKISAFRAFKKAGEKLEKGMSVIIFPEGKIPDHPPDLGPFKSGAFKLAIELQIPIVPVTFARNWELCMDDGKESGTHPGVIQAYVHRPIETRGLTDEDADNLRDQVFNIINLKLQSYANK